jgi:hypothetical protein
MQASMASFELKWLCTCVAMHTDMHTNGPGRHAGPACMHAALVQSIIHSSVSLVQYVVLVRVRLTMDMIHCMRVR